MNNYNRNDSRLAECIEHPGAVDLDGYGVKKYQGKPHKAHRLAFCEAHNFKPEDIKGFVIMHDCDNPKCINPDHLSLGTHQTNVKDKVAKKRQARGEKIGVSKLKWFQVLDIKERLSAGESGSRLAKEYNVSNIAISKIKTGKTWRHVTVDIEV
jgi:hypothetical protein